MSSSELTVPPPAATASVAARRERPSGGWALLGSEISVMFRRWRTWAMFAALAAIPVLIAVAVRITGGSSRGPAFLSDISSNGLFVAFTALVVCVPLFLPLTIGVVAGDTIAGEASHGTLRYLVIAPAGRLRLLGVKYAGCAAFCVAGCTVAFTWAVAVPPLPSSIVYLNETLPVTSGGTVSCTALPPWMMSRPPSAAGTGVTCVTVSTSPS